MFSKRNSPVTIRSPSTKELMLTVELCKKLLLSLFALLFITMGCCSLYLLDKALHYRKIIHEYEGQYVNEGLRLITISDINRAHVPNLGVFVGG